MGATKKLITESFAMKPVEQNVKLFKINCSSIGKIMGKKGLGATGESYLKQWYVSKKYHRKKDFFIKYVEKGLAVEHIAIEMLSATKGIELYKNDEWFEDEFMQGIPDIVEAFSVTDTKASWDIFSFPMCEIELKNDDYDWQLQGYMALTGKSKAAIAYCLIDTPEPLIQQEIKKLYYKTGGETDRWQPEDFDAFKENYKFNDIPFEDRIRIFEVERDNAKIELIKTRVLECREWIKNNLK